MLPEIMHHCLFLIITFSANTLCIQNGNALTFDKLESNTNFSPEARQSAFHPSAPDSTGFIPSTGPGFRFPDNHQYNTNIPNETPALGHRNPYPNNNKITNSNQGANPHNLALNTGEYSANANNHYNYLYRQHPNAIASVANRDSPNTPNANDFYISQQASTQPYHQLNYKNPNYPPQRYQPYPQRPTYAQAYDNYLFNGPSNYNRVPTPPPPPPPQSSQSSSYSPYQQQDGHLTAPYRNDLTSPAATYPSLGPIQFGNFALPFGGVTGVGAANPLGNLLNSFGAPFGARNPLSMQIIRGLENIARNDDLQCVPKVLCQMLGSPTRRAQLPGFITSPVLTSFVASLPSSSPALIFGRAALLGLSGGEYSCAQTYPKCPQNEDDILYYLNNHHGGFFKFFNEPGSQPAFTTPAPATASPSSQSSIFNFLTGLGATTTNTNTNQGNLNSFMGDAVTNGIGSLFGNIISGFLSGQTATRRKDDDEHENDNDNEEDGVADEDPDENSDLIESNSTTTKPEGRILNNKSNILAYVEQSNSNPISFPPENGNDNYEAQQIDTEFRFPSTSSHRDVENRPDDSRRGKRVNFIDLGANQPSYGTKMIFPDRTGTGNLRFDNDEYFRVGKIINRPDYDDGYKRREREREEAYRTTRRPVNYNSYNTKVPYSSSSYYNRYASSNYRKDKNLANSEDTTGNVYVTNAQGVTEYYINAQGRKIYLKR